MLQGSKAAGINVFGLVGLAPRIEARCDVLLVHLGGDEGHYLLHLQSTHLLCERHGGGFPYGRQGGCESRGSRVGEQQQNDLEIRADITTGALL